MNAFKHELLVTGYHLITRHTKHEDLGNNCFDEGDTEIIKQRGVNLWKSWFTGRNRGGVISTVFEGCAYTLRNEPQSGTAGQSNEGFMSTPAKSELLTQRSGLFEAWSRTGLAPRRTRMFIYNEETNQMEAFVPRHDPVRFYVGGPTSRGDPHVGHARTFVMMDVVRRYLEYCGYQVRVVENFSDIDRKILEASRREGIEFSEFAERYIRSYFRTMDALKVKRADQYTRTSDFIPSTIAFIERLIARGYAYEIHGNVFFATGRFARFGCLSHKPRVEMQALMEIASPEKRSPWDFELWCRMDSPTPVWQSPWGSGRPGWHIEGSAVVSEALGETIDIRGGGEDLVFPHHECELALSEAAFDQGSYVKYWMHVALVELESGEKMSHSSRFTTVSSLLETYPASAIRLYVLSTHHRDRLTYSEDALVAAASRWRAYEHLKTLRSVVDAHTPDDSKVEESKNAKSDAQIASVLQSNGLAGRSAEILTWLSATYSTITCALDSDFDTPAALGAVDELCRQLATLGPLSSLEIGTSSEARRILSSRLHDLCLLIENVLGL